ncbi:hypothetical protein AB0H71_18770 [Nocardia sp. NPDC050697]|uniref:hypothetical protein n=1 Tax=Nocardia sp. NPDC050697 TaxID=3155158 RepID=UPI003403066D
MRYSVPRATFASWASSLTVICVDPFSVNNRTAAALIRRSVEFIDLAFHSAAEPAANRYRSELYQGHIDILDSI